MVTRKDVARLANVSVATVSNVVNNKIHVTQKVRDRVFEAIKSLDYIPNYNAKGLKNKRSYHIGVAVYETTNPSHMEVINGMEDYASSHGYIVSTFVLGKNIQEDELNTILGRRLDGIVNFLTNEYPGRFIRLMQSSGTEMMNFDKTISSIIGTDFYLSTKQHMDHLISLGHRHIAFISSFGENEFSIDTRGKAYMDALKEYQLNYGDKYVYYNHDSSKFSDVIGFDGCDYLFERHKEVTAIFCTNDVIAMAAIRRLADKGLNCPKHISVIGCDDISFAKLFIPSLSTMRIDKHEQGRAIAKQLIDQIQGNEKIVHYDIAEPIFRDSVSVPYAKE